ncbi:unnamed protein product (macronuclear) [Paramecium tetraurelia]|uniref:Uncharacterized protein n=1 Tax=Paramecium tetraurelia TaxID=5888 RepID=A0DA17_PARTE|nr:uncharacterized protein GSPATT00014816001 [Paramecium tetraurelia]CAK79884.1 unnamed protein product [Paramecium tetraurelia]|eukprot:XP_001447281.1 hypothetical protein (macronuclear) [Paramecium tetraurelia strain d4-2]
MGKLHGTLAKAGKVRKQTPKIEKQVRRHKIPKGRAYKRICFNRRFGSAATSAQGPQQKRKGPNWHAGRKDLIEEERKKQVEQRRQRKKQDNK